MIKLYPFLICFTFSSASLYSQSNCSNTTKVNICPDVFLTGETNAGAGDDAPMPCNITGEDVVYEISVSNAAQKIFISVVNASMPLRLSMEETICGSGVCNSYMIPMGNTNLIFNVTTSGNYFLWVDAAGSASYDIGFGADTGSVWINIPNTQGNLQLDSSYCSVPVFHPSKPFFQVSYNSVYQTHPMTLSPLSVTGIMCVSVFFKNTTGDEGIKQFEFDFNPVGYTSVTTADSIPGFYNDGYWRSVTSGITTTFVFDDSLGTGRGDFTGSPNACLKYEFCFNVIHVSNDPQLTNVEVRIFSDGFGMGYSGFQPSGCCPGPVPNCLGAGGGGAGAAQAFGFGFADPGNPLPISLLNFYAEVTRNNVILKWITASEINNDFFTVERSLSGDSWESVGTVKGAGNSNINIAYSLTDNTPLPGLSFYRLRQTDFNGSSNYSQVISVNFKNHYLYVYPNPANGMLIIESEEISETELILYNSTGKKLVIPVTINNDQKFMDTSSLASGLYLLVISSHDQVISSQKIVIR